MLIPVSANEEALYIDIEFPDFYEITTGCKCIGVVGYNYTGIVTIRAQNKEVNLTNKILEIECNYRDTEKRDPDRAIFIYKGLDCVKIYDQINLSEKLNTTLLGKGENKSFPINIFFRQTGFHEMRCKEKGESKWYIWSISIIEPIEWEKLTKQAELIEAEKESAQASERSAQASEETANSTKWLARVTFFLAIFTAFLAFITVRIEGIRRKDRKRRFLNILLAEFKSNMTILNHLKEEIKKLQNNEISERKLLWIDLRDDGWNEFRNQGGFEYIRELLYNEIAEFYNLWYKLGEDKKVERSYDELKNFYISLTEDENSKICELISKNDELQDEIYMLLEENEKLTLLSRLFRIALFWNRLSKNRRS
jgi:hypothetical protein